MAARSIWKDEEMIRGYEVDKDEFVLVTDEELDRLQPEKTRDIDVRRLMRGKEYLVAILAENGILRAETLRFADELRTPEDTGLPRKVKLPQTKVKELWTCSRRASPQVAD